MKYIKKVMEYIKIEKKNILDTNLDIVCNNP